MPCILLFETEYSLEFVYTNLRFLSRPSDTKIQTAITWCLQQQKSQKFENVRLWTSIFRYENLKIVSLITSELFNRNLSIVHPTLFFNSAIAPFPACGQNSILIFLYLDRIYDSVITRENMDTILSIYRKIRIRKSPHFAIFHAMSCLTFLVIT